jgi:hypothetical protein
MAEPTLDDIVTAVQSARGFLPPVYIDKIEMPGELWEQLKAQTAADPTWAATPPGSVVRQLLGAVPVYVTADGLDEIVVHYRLRRTT